MQDGIYIFTAIVFVFIVPIISHFAARTHFLMPCLFTWLLTSNNTVDDVVDK